MLTGTLSARAYSFFDTLVWIALTLLGLGVFGVGPATAAAQLMVRKRSAGDAPPLLRGFASGYFRNLARANALSLPLLAVAVALALNWNYFSSGRGLLPQLAAAGVFVLSIFVAGTACYVFPMYARYELRLPQYLLMSSRFAVRHLAGTAILLFVAAAVFYASRWLPGLVPFFSIGAWLYLTGWLCDRFFAANDQSVTAAGEPAGTARLHRAATG